MISLTRAQVFKYKSIEDSTPVDIDYDVTVLVGKNESGKSAFLEALHKAIPAVERAKFNYIFDYPRKDYVKYRQQHEAKSYAKVVELTYCIGKEVADQINADVFNGDAVIPEDLAFSRTTHYGNGSTIGLNIDNAAALKSFKSRLQGIEHVDEVFEGGAALSDVIQAIDKLQLAPDSTLGSFASLWKERGKTKGSTWDHLEFYLWRTYLSTSIPYFLYFDDYHLLEGKINLDSLANREAADQLTDADETALGLFELAGTSVEELRSEEGYETSKAKLEAIGLTITEQVFQYWRQNKDLSVEFDIKADPTDTHPFNSGKNLYIRIKNSRHGVTVPFDQRSKGFIWFFSFIAWFSSVQERVGTDKTVALLLDEPGLNLHALAQHDLLAYLQTLARSHQIIYTTHSPFMVGSERLEQVRVVEDRAKEGTKITRDLATSSDESVFPLQAALGYSIAQNLFISKKNILVEGPADFLLLQHLSAIMEADHRQGINGGIFVPVGGLDKLVTFVALLGANKLDLVVLHDRGAKPPQALEELVQQKLIARKKILDYGMFRSLENLETDIEDLVPEPLYLNAFNAAYEKELGGITLAPGDLPVHPRIVERINRWLVGKNVTLKKGGGFNHYRVAQALLPLLTIKSVPVTALDVFESLFKRLNAILG